MPEELALKEAMDLSQDTPHVEWQIKIKFLRQIIL